MRKSGFFKHENQYHVSIIATSVFFYEYILGEDIFKMRFC